MAMGAEESSSPSPMAARRRGTTAEAGLRATAKGEEGEPVPRRQGGAEAVARSKGGALRGRCRHGDRFQRVALEGARADSASSPAESMLGWHCEVGKVVAEA